jgi:hypothetical protein
VLQGVLDAAFFAESWGQKPHRVRGIQSVPSLVRWDELSRVLETHRLTAPRLRVVRDGKPVDESSYIRSLTSRRGVRLSEVIPSRLTALLAEGNTLVVDAIDEILPRVRAVADELEHILHERTQANLYASWRPERGFSCHWDDHDVIVLQVAGTKHWRLYGVQRPYPLYRDSEPNEPTPTDVVEELVLSPGDVFYLPRGWWHDARAMEGASLHLTFGITNRDGTHFLSWLVDEMRKADLARVDIPRFASDEVLRQHITDLREEFLRRWDSEAITRFLAEYDEHASARPILNLPHVDPENDLHSSSRVSLGVPRPVVFHCSADRVEVRALGQVWRFAPEAEPLLRALNGGPVAFADLAARFDSLGAETVRALVTDLAARGLVTVADGAE